MPRFAAIDLGSNASRLLIVEARDPRKVDVFRNVRVPVRLGHSVFQTGRLDPSAIDHAVAALREFADAMAEADVVAYRAVVTASARSASNADVLLHRAHEEAEVELRAVDGLEEARLVALAVGRVVPLEGHVLLADLGGGSLELTELADGNTEFSTSLPIGSVRMLEAFLQKGGRVNPSEEELVHEYLERVLGPHRRRLRARAFDSVVCTGGNFEAIAKLCPAAGAKAPTIDVAAARALCATMKGLTSRERMTRYGLRDDRADVIVPALYVVDALARLSRAERLVAPGVGLKEGIAAELVAKHFHVWDYERAEEAVLGAALQLGRRYHFDERHATQVTALATQLFDVTKRIHRLGPRDRTLLRIASLLHDIGDFVQPSSHHKHTAYLIRHGGLMGLDDPGREIVAQIARYHRKSHPTLRHPEYKALSLEDRNRVRVLAGLLRVGDALDRGHRSKVSGFEAHVRRGKLAISVVTDEDASLEAWTLDRKAELLEQALELDVVLSVTGSASAGGSEMTDAVLHEAQKKQTPSPRYVVTSPKKRSRSTKR